MRRLGSAAGAPIVMLVTIVTVALLLAGGREILDRSPTARTPVPMKTSSARLSKKLTLLPAPADPQRRRQVVASRIAGLRLINYYAAADGWTKMWTNWNPAVLKSDFARIQALGANAVRIVVFPDAFGWPQISDRMAVRFADTLKIAASRDLGVQVTLFDWWGSYNEIAQSRAWLKALLQPYASNPEIQLVELKNEVNASDPAEVAWVRALLPTLRSVMPRTPSTVSVSGTEGPAGFARLCRELAGAPIDVADIHFYGDQGTAYSWMLAAKRAAGSLPLFVGEIGFPVTVDSYGGLAAAELRQAQWFSVVFAAARAAGVSTPAPWILYDFRPGAIPVQEQDPSAYFFGLYSATGQWRPSVWVVQQAFADRNVDISNLSFNLGGQNNMLAWTPYLPQQGKLAYDSEVGYIRPGSVRLSGTWLSQAGAPSFCLVPTNPAIAGQLWTVSAWAKGINVNGSAQLAVDWFNSDGSYIGETSSRPLPPGHPRWTKLLVRTQVPSNATSVLLNLRSDGVAGTVWFDYVQITVTP